MILARPMAFSSGFESYLDNVGEMRNTGWEISLNGVLIDRPDMRWDLTVMAATQKNKVLSLTPETPEIVDGSPLTREGLPIYTYYMPKFAGVDPATGRRSTMRTRIPTARRSTSTSLRIRPSRRAAATCAAAVFPICSAASAPTSAGRTSTSRF